MPKLVTSTHDQAHLPRSRTRGPNVRGPKPKYD